MTGKTGDELDKPNQTH